jgi:hypothetical protein
LLACQLSDGRTTTGTNMLGVTIWRLAIFTLHVLDVTIPTSGFASDDWFTLPEVTHAIRQAHESSTLCAQS